MSHNDIDDLVAVVRAVGQERIAPLATVVDRTQTYSPELWTLLCELGVTSVPFSERDGGTVGSFLAFTRIVEELAYAGAVSALYVSPTVQVARAIRRFGTEEQWLRWGLPMVQSQSMGAWAFTEPSTGSDPRQVETKAVRDGADWVINGRKMFISFAPYADVALVFAKTTPDRLGAFLVETSNPGWQPGVPLNTLAFGGQGTSPVWLEDIRVPGDALLGGPEDGFDVMISTEAEGKVRASAMCVGLGRRALEESVTYASQRLHRGEPIGTKFPTVQVSIGEMSAQVDAVRVMVHHCAAAIDSNDPHVKTLAASARIVASRMAREVTSTAIQVCGAYGFTHDMVLERLYREGKFYEVGQGVIDLQKIIVGKHRLREVLGTR